LAKELGWSTNDILDISGHELNGLVKRVLDWKKNNQQSCPLLTGK